MDADEAIEALVDDLPEPVITVIADLQEEVESLTKRLEEAEVALAKSAEAEDDDDPEVAISKALDSLPAGVADILKSERAALAKAQEALAAQHEVELESTYIAKAAALPFIVAEPEAFGPLMQRVAKVAPDEAEYIEKLFGLANERLAFSGLFSEFGSNVPTPGSADERVEAIAKGLQASDPGLSVEAARAKAWEDNPEMYEQYLAERQGR